MAWFVNWIHAILSFIFLNISISENSNAKNIQRFAQNFMPYKMIYHLPHISAFLKFRFLKFTQEIFVETTKYTVLFIISCPTKWCTIYLRELNFIFPSSPICEKFCWLPCSLSALVSFSMFFITSVLWTPPFKKVL